MTDYGRQYLADSEVAQIPFASVGKHVLIHSRVNLINVESIHLGSNIRIDADVTIAANQPVRIGDYVHLGAQSYLAGAAGIVMEDFSGLSQAVKIYSVSDDYSGKHLTNPTIPKRYLSVNKGQVTLGRHVIVGAGTIILPGVDLAEGCCVGALSLVGTATRPWGVYAGVPATRRRERSRDLLELEKLLLGSHQTPAIQPDEA